ncbi:glycosyltransferase family 4 protein [Leptospira limi]|uniref:Glycosyltransferase family 4 protein n=1 Tax=Leptospira limi TaxID=2950023 RepID=A0ABT3LYZ9_9LEPT|nr:glycosyltransferase family 1 protein [Leptospira limi]MCW7462949.1 glycosyltransferase family 4 protein [Leptospira limi]
MILGIDASNIRGGGGVTHLVELLKAAEPKQFQFQKVIVWGGRSTLDKIEERSWMEKVYEPLLNKSLFHRIYWGKFLLPKRISTGKVDLLFVPGANYSGNFKPYVSMSQNLLPFEWKEIKRYGFSKNFFRLILLFFSQTLSFKKADGIIFLTEFARKVVFDKINLLNKQTEVVFHGINQKFFQKPKSAKDISNYSIDKPFKILYVSFVGEYKHQWNVVYAVGKLMKNGYPITFDLVGGADEKKPVERLKLAINDVDPLNKYIHYHSSIQYSEIEIKYKEADLFVFASSCETFGQIVLEAMAAGLPIVCSELSAMKEILKDAGDYFNPLDIESIEESIKRVIDSKDKRNEYSNRAYVLAKEFSWKRTANQTFGFFHKIKGRFDKV